MKYLKRWSQVDRLAMYLNEECPSQKKKKEKNLDKRKSEPTVDGDNPAPEKPRNGSIPLQIPASNGFNYGVPIPNSNSRPNLAAPSHPLSVFGGFRLV